MLLQFQLSNVFTSLSAIHYFYQLLSHLAFVRWPLQALLVGEYGFDRCNDKQVHPILDWMGVDNGSEGFTVAIGWMLINLAFWRGLPLWMLIWKVNPSGGKKVNASTKQISGQKNEDEEYLEESTINSNV